MPNRLSLKSRRVRPNARQRTEMRCLGHYRERMASSHPRIYGRPGPGARSHLAVWCVDRGCSALVCSVSMLALAACSEMATLPVSAGMGAQPTLPPPHPTLLPTMHIAPAKGWPAGATPVAASGLSVAAFASGLDHPRWLYVLPNGDVLVAETNAPPKPDDRNGIKGWVKGVAMKRAGAETPSANRITLLRDTHGSGVADFRSVLLEGLHSPFGMVLVGDVLYVADSDAVLRFPYAAGETHIAAPAVTVVVLPAGRINHHWTKNLIASPDGSKLYVTVGSNSNAAERGMAVEVERAAIWEVDKKSGAHRVFASGLRNPNGLVWEPLCGPLSMSATSSAAT